jgi:SAM-dependent methyltransferase
MADSQSWRQGLHEFFDLRGEAIEGAPSDEDLCYIAGRDPRMWMDPAMREDLTQSILGLSAMTAQSSVLEVGSAAGFLAKFIAPNVRAFTGVDLAEAPLKVARRLGLANAVFQKAEGENLPFAGAIFDCVFCYDVFTNFPSFDDGTPLIKEMLRAVKPGGKVLVGSIPDADRAADLPAHIIAVAKDLETRFGPYKPYTELVPRADAFPPVAKQGFFARLFKAAPASAPVVAITPIITTYDFAKNDFLTLGKMLGVDVVIHDIHKLNPYFSYRFNAVFTRKGA